MGRYGRKKKRSAVKKLMLGLTAAAVVIPGALSTLILYKQAKAGLESLGAGAAIFSALYSVPDKSLEQLERRFSDKAVSQKEETPAPTTQEEESSDKPPAKPYYSGQPEKDAVPGISREIFAARTIPDEYKGNIIEENMSAKAGKGLLSFGLGVIKNSTSLTDKQVEEYLAEENRMKLDSSGPQVLIMHTHATESFEPYDSENYDTRSTWRSTDNNENIVAAGESMAEAVRAHGIEVLHDTTQHDYPSYNGSYERSAATVKDYLERYPSIKVVLDVHRDAVQRDSTLVKPVTEINGRKAAQLMIISGCDDGTMGMPDWDKNLRFAAGMQDAIERHSPVLTRPVFFCYRKYNQELTSGSLLIEIGSHGNTLDEVLYTASLAGDAIGGYLCSLK